MLAASPGKRLHLFDTFEGLPHGEGDFQAGEWKGSMADVKRTLADEADRLEFHAGLFPASAAGWRIFGSRAFTFTLTSISMTALWRLCSGSGQG
jgi:hypothetical protein